MLSYSAPTLSPLDFNVTRPAERESECENAGRDLGAERGAPGAPVEIRIIASPKNCEDTRPHLRSPSGCQLNDADGLAIELQVCRTARQLRCADPAARPGAARAPAAAGAIARLPKDAFGGKLDENLSAQLARDFLGIAPA